MRDQRDPERLALSIIIVSWNTRDRLRDCLLSVAEHTRQHAYEVWVVDNNSHDGTRDMVENEFPEVELIQNTENVGFGRANNQAFERVHGQYVTLLNPDTVLQNDALDQMVNFLDDHEDYGAVGPRLVDPNGRLQPACARTAPNTLTVARGILGLPRLTMVNESNQEQCTDVDVLSGACMTVRKDIIPGELFYNRYFMYGEDVDLCWDIRTRIHRKIRYLGTAVVMHFGGESSKQASYLALEEAYSIYCHLSRSKGICAALAARVLYLAGALMRLPVGIVRWVIMGQEGAKAYLREQVAVMLWSVGLCRRVGGNRES